MVEQLELFTRRMANSKAYTVAKLTAAISRGHWYTRAELVRSGLTEREIRYARQHSQGAIIFGQRGYRLTDDATLDEIHACIATLESQAKEMMDAAVQLRRKAHGRIR